MNGRYAATALLLLVALAGVEWSDVTRRTTVVRYSALGETTVDAPT